ncbi:hypothetical protein ASL20_13330 [Cupriavidus necator]|uniref:protoporphyrinogen/coproporphyrinogen oxidase n=1 Tax=Cupriavidus necator TaxID=106590 RepID=UPI0007358D39|nr:FAD-dependent oxidoreductase [Cupriavidus necator]KUE88475.1 hypothetical protein ASL20_13330 [Cupriavidus necator]
MNQPVSIVVVGAGISGLTAAYRLTAAGFTVQVLESQSAVGGRMAQRREGPISYNTGARLIYPFGQAFHSLLAELDLTRALVPLRKLGANAAIGGDRYRVELMPGPRTLMTPGLDWRSRIRMVAAGVGLARLRSRTDPDAAASYLEGDTETLADYISRTTTPAVLKQLIEPIFRGTRSWNPEDISAAFYVSTMPHLLGKDTVYTLAEGMGQVTQELGRRVPVLCDARAYAIERHAEGQCIVRYRRLGQEHELRANVVVCATEGAQAGKLIVDPLDAERSMLEAVRYNKLGVVHYALEGDIPAELEFSGRQSTTRIATWQQLPAAPIAGRSHAQLYCQLTPEAAEEADRLGLADSLDTLIRSEVRQRIPRFDSRVHTIVNQWIPYKLPIFYPGYCRKVADFLTWQSAARRSVYYCGDYLSQALLTGACASGDSIAKAILAHHG